MKSDGTSKLVCTGATNDFRISQHFSYLQKLLRDPGIMDSVFILGHIPKIDQIVLLKKSLGIIQPTLFEWGSDGRSTHDAISMGIPAIESSIRINLEIKCERVDFFNVSDHVDLSIKMISLKSSRCNAIPNVELWGIRNKNNRRCSEFVFNIAQQCILDFQNK